MLYAAVWSHSGVGAREEEEEDWKESPDEAEEEEEEDMVAEEKGFFLGQWLVQSKEMRK
jgi:hypothetical protein